MDKIWDVSEYGEDRKINPIEQKEPEATSDNISQTADDLFSKLFFGDWGI